MPIDARTSGGVYKVVSKILTADGSEIGKVVDSTGRIIYEASRLITVTGVPPISFTKSIGKPLVSWDLLGNGSQSETPSPDNIIMPDFCGVRTANLLNLNRTYSKSFTTDTTKWMNGAATINYAGKPYAETEILGDVIKVTSKSPGYGASFLIEASPNTTYTVSFETDKTSSGSWGGISDRDMNGTVISTLAIQGKSATFTTNSDCAFLNVCFRFPPADGTVTFSNIMLNTGSTALPYEPYGYKIPFNNHGDNLFDKTATDTSNGYISSGFLNSNGEKQTNQRYCVSEYIPVSPNRSYTLLYGVSAHAPSVCFYDSSKNFISGTPYNGKKTVLFTAPQNAEFLRLSYALIDSEIVMLNTGSTAKPYSPYFSETVPVYLGQTPTVRRVKKVVLTGEETGWTENSSGTNTLRAVLQLSDANENGASGYCSHTKFVTSGVSRDEELAGTLNGNLYLRIRKTIAPDITAFKQWLADEYANSAPVCVWYVLATEQTGIVNEPLAKIGDYADELHSIDAGVSIPTANGNNTLTVDTDLQPSSMTIVYKGR